MKRKRSPIEQLEEVYSRIPRVACRPGCTECCGPILMTWLERKRIEEKLGPVKWLTPIVALTLAAIGKSSKATNDALTCPAVKDGRCGAYAVRPLICRVFGAVRDMPCPEGCKPERWLSEDEGREIQARVEEIAHKAATRPTPLRIRP